MILLGFDFESLDFTHSRTSPEFLTLQDGDWSMEETPG